MSDWRDEAICATTDAAEMWFPDRADDGTAAMHICWNRCEVREACLEVGMTASHGIWGGLTAEQRTYRAKRIAEEGLA